MTNSGRDRVYAWDNIVPFEIKVAQEESKKCA